MLIFGGTGREATILNNQSSSAATPLSWFHLCKKIEADRRASVLAHDPFTSERRPHMLREVLFLLMIRICLTLLIAGPPFARNPLRLRLHRSRKAFTSCQLARLKRRQVIAAGFDQHTVPDRRDGDHASARWRARFDRGHLSRWQYVAAAGFRHHDPVLRRTLKPHAAFGRSSWLLW